MNINSEAMRLFDRIIGGTPVRVTDSRPRLNPAERELANALYGIAKKYGTFDESGCGIYAAYESGSINETQNIGVMCKNCVFFNGVDSCQIIAFPVEATGKCRFAVIPDGVVKMPKV